VEKKSTLSKPNKCPFEYRVLFFIPNTFDSFIKRRVAALHPAKLKDVQDREAAVERNFNHEKLG
jgi:hypothetical protein